MLKHLKLEGVGPSAKFEIEFANRLTMLAGDNGLGKTLLLELAWWSITREFWQVPIVTDKSVKEPRIVAGTTDPNGKVDEVGIVYDRQRLGWSFENGVGHGADVCIFAGSDGSLAVWDAIRSFNILEENNAAPVWRGNAINTPPHRDTVYYFDQSTILNGLANENGNVFCRGLIADLVEWQTRSVDQTLVLFDFWSEVLKHMSPPDEKMRPGPIKRLHVHDVREIPTIQFDFGEVPITLCSSAVLRILTLSYLLVWSWKEHLELVKLTQHKSHKRLVLIIDELDLHLHPKWQRTILKTILSVAQLIDPDCKTQLVTTSHSPLVLASTEMLLAK